MVFYRLIKHSCFFSSLCIGDNHRTFFLLYIKLLFYLICLFNFHSLSFHAPISVHKQPIHSWSHIRCFYFYSHVLEIDWIFNNQVVGHGSALERKSVQVPSASENMEGEYLCEAKLTGFQTVRGTVSLKVVGKCLWFLFYILYLNGGPFYTSLKGCNSNVEVNIFFFKF